jgi:hypothetical protein
MNGNTPTGEEIDTQAQAAVVDAPTPDLTADAAAIEPAASDTETPDEMLARATPEQLAEAQRLAFERQSQPKEEKAEPQGETVPEPETDKPGETPVVPDPDKEPEPTPETEPEHDDEPKGDRFRVKDWEPRNAEIARYLARNRDATVEDAIAHVDGKAAPAEEVAEPPETEAIGERISQLETDLDAAEDINGDSYDPAKARELRGEIRKAERELTRAEVREELDAERRQDQVRSVVQQEADARRASREKVIADGFGDAQDAKTDLGKEVQRLTEQYASQGKYEDGTWVNPVLRSSKAPELVVLEAAANISFVPKGRQPAGQTQPSPKPAARPVTPPAAMRPTTTAPGAARPALPATVTPAAAMQQLEQLSPEQLYELSAKIGERQSGARPSLAAFT